MAETEDQREERLLRELEGKNVANYSVLLSAWIQTKMERDKTLVTLSAAAIGLLVTILATVGVNSVWEILFYVISVTSFAVTIWSSLKIYQLNSEHLEEAIRGASGKDPRLEKYDIRSIKAFIIGSISAVLIGILSASSQLITSEENIMSKKSGTTKSTVKPVTIKESVNGVSGLNPNSLSKKSLNGVGSLSPQQPQQTSQSQNQNNTSAQSNSGNKK